jgi:GINS complex subunit 4
MSTENDLLFDEFGYKGPAPREQEERIGDSTQFVQHLTQAWINERAAPDVLQYEKTAIDGLLAKIEEQVRS